MKEGEEEEVYKLRKVLYGLKQALRTWYSQIDSYFMEQEFKKSKSEQHYIWTQGNSNIITVALYVGDLFYTNNNKKMIADFKKDMTKRYKMDDMGLL